MAINITIAYNGGKDGSHDHTSDFLAKSNRKCTKDRAQKIDMLDVSAGGTNQLWFTNLMEKKNRYKLM